MLSKQRRTESNSPTLNLILIREPICRAASDQPVGLTIW
jgi:hypothetical protein